MKKAIVFLGVFAMMVLAACQPVFRAYNVVDPEFRNSSRDGEWFESSGDGMPVRMHVHVSEGLPHFPYVRYEIKNTSNKILVLYPYRAHLLVRDIAYPANEIWVNSDKRLRDTTVSIGQNHKVSLKIAGWAGSPAHDVDTAKLCLGDFMLEGDTAIKSLGCPMIVKMNER